MVKENHCWLLVEDRVGTSVSGFSLETLRNFPHLVLWLPWHKETDIQSQTWFQNTKLDCSFSEISVWDATCCSHTSSKLKHYPHLCLPCTSFQIVFSSTCEAHCWSLLMHPDVSLPLAFDFKRGTATTIPWPDIMIKQPRDKILMLEVARSCAPLCVTMGEEKLRYHTDTAL